MPEMYGFFVENGSITYNDVQKNSCTNYENIWKNNYTLNKFYSIHRFILKRVSLKIWTCKHPHKLLKTSYEGVCLKKIREE